jgi:hypothetical protein
MSQNNNEVNESDKTLEMKSQLKSFFTFTIENFIELNDSEIKSSKFSIGDTKWYVKVYPRYMKDNIEYITAFLIPNVLLYYFRLYCTENERKFWC